MNELTEGIDALTERKNMKLTQIQRAIITDAYYIINDHQKEIDRLYNKLVKEIGFDKEEYDFEGKSDPEHRYSVSPVELLFDGIHNCADADELAEVLLRMDAILEHRKKD